MLTSNSELKGLVRYNNNTGTLSYQNGPESRSFTPRSVVAFEFFDEKQQKQRLFYSLDYEDDKTQAKRPYFFEVIKDYNEFGLLSKTDPVEFMKERSLAGKMINQTPSSNTLPENNTIAPYHKVGVFQLETIYLFDLTDLTINPIVEISNETVDRLLFSDDTKVKDKLVGRDYLKKFLNTKYKILMEYIDQQELNLANRDHLIKFFDYYHTNLR